MKKFKKILCLRVIGLSFLISLTTKGEVESKINKFELSSCSDVKKKCIVVSADKAQSGSMSPSLALNNVVVEIKNKDNKVIETYKNDKGFYDLETNRIILSKLTKNDILKETVIFMKDLEVQKMEMR